MPSSGTGSEDKGTSSGARGTESMGDKVKDVLGLSKEDKPMTESIKVSPSEL